MFKPSHKRYFGRWHMLNYRYLTNCYGQFFRYSTVFNCVVFNFNFFVPTTFCHFVRIFAFSKKEFRLYKFASNTMDYKIFITLFFVQIERYVTMSKMSLDHLNYFNSR